MNVLVEYRGGLSAPVLLEPGETGVPYDGQQPGSARVPMKPAEKLHGSQRGFLDDVFGVVVVAGEPARQVIGRVQMRNDNPFEACEVNFGWQRMIFPQGALARYYIPSTALCYSAER